MNPFRWSFRAQFLLGFLICLSLLGYALYVQFVQKLEPCPFCIFQRLAFAATGVLFLLGALHGPRGAGGRRVYGVLAFIAAAVGIGTQRLPGDVGTEGGDPVAIEVDTVFFSAFLIGVAVRVGGRGKQVQGITRFVGDGGDEKLAVFLAHLRINFTAT